MIKALINGILNILITIVDIILTPLNLLLENVFPDVSDMISYFSQCVSTLINQPIRYFFTLLPPHFRSLIVLFITFVISYYGVYYAYIGLKKIFDIIQKIKLW